MTDRYERIRKALEMGPTPVSWAQDIDEDEAYAMFCCRSAAEAAFILACDPDTIRALLDERDALFARAESDAALLRQALEALLGQRGEPYWHTCKQNAIAALRERLGKCMEQKA